ncbi:ribonuclease P protein component [bacterium]|nr:ribonuclease P protein component [bacterium]
MDVHYTLSKRYRITRKTHFEMIFGKGEKVDTPYFRLHYCSKIDIGLVAFAAPRRVGGAVDRNKSKRRIREAYRLVAPHLDASVPGMVFVAKTHALSVPFPKLKDAVKGAMARVATIVTG